MLGGLDRILGQICGPENGAYFHGKPPDYDKCVNTISMSPPIEKGVFYVSGPFFAGVHSIASRLLQGEL
jgi:hypothetical protein